MKYQDMENCRIADSKDGWCFNNYFYLLTSKTTIRNITHAFPIDMGHPLLENLRQGNWALDYIISRIKNYEELHHVHSWLQREFAKIRELPRFQIPKYFFAVMSQLYRQDYISTCKFTCSASVNYALSNMSSYVQHNTLFVKHLALCSLQVMGHLKSCPLLTGCEEPSLAAGLPHFWWVLYLLPSLQY